MQKNHKKFKKSQNPKQKTHKKRFKKIKQKKLIKNSKKENSN